ncbi:MAG TPA: MBL fold metallo-hydrolase [Polyangiaceae bacterium]|nr:MBL fold metallo-hydrolase [Polyangiaceae bacterium]
MRLRGLIAVALSLTLPGCGFAWRALKRNLAAPPERTVAHKLVDPKRPEARLSALWIGHATVLVQLDDRFVLTDPVFAHTLAQASPRLVEPGFDPKHLPPLAAVVVSHMHFDHLSFGSLDLVEQRTPVVLVPPGVRANMPRYAFEIRELETWASYEHDGLRVTAVPVQHVGGRYALDAAFETRAFTGYVFEYHGLSVYFGGDTGYIPSAFKATRVRFPNLSLALLPICPDAPRDFMQYTHVGPSQALDAFMLLGARQMIPIHFDTYINSDDATGACPTELRARMQTRGLSDDQVPILAIGEQRVLIAK